jgi:hypothetical protein
MRRKQRMQEEMRAGKKDLKYYLGAEGKKTESYRKADPWINWDPMTFTDGYTFIRR